MNREDNAHARHTLIVITGATASGKTALAIQLAHVFNAEIISADSRQIYRGIPIGTAAPTQKQLSEVKHYFVGMLDLEQHYSAAKFESDVLALLPKLWKDSDYAIMCGGSMMYIDAVTNGIDELPEISPEIRQQVVAMYNDTGIAGIQQKLLELDPEYYEIVDKSNYKRIIHAIEITLEAGVPYSTLRTGKKAVRDFNIIKIAIDMPRAILFDRINARVDAMIANGLEKESDALYHLRHLNSLNTLGYKELFAVKDGIMDRQTAISRIAKNTRVYAKKQLTWMKSDPEIHFVPHTSALQSSLEWIRQFQRPTLPDD